MLEMLLVTTQTQWDTFITTLQGHLLQTWAWGELKSRFGWSVERIQIEGGAAQLLFRRLPLGQRIAYIPKGPVVDWSNPYQCQALFSAVHERAREQRAIFLKIEPHVWDSDCNPDSTSPRPAAAILSQAGFVAADTIQPRTSQVIDISGKEDHILAAMKQKTRYNIRLARKKKVSIRHGDAADVTTFYELARVTAARDGFGIHTLDYYQTAYALFAPDHGALLIAEYGSEPLAALLTFRQGTDAYYFYGASSNRHRNLMPSYLLQWAAIQWAKKHGCTCYDLWGIPDANPDTLEAEFQHRQDGLWGVYRFKRGFGGNIVRSVGAYDYVYNPFLYRLYRLYRKFL